MVSVEQVLPLPDKRDAEDLVDQLRSASRSFEPFDDRTVSFVADLARYFRRDPACRRVGAIGALGYWIRNSSIERLRLDWKELGDTSPELVYSKRGVVFHIPPSNVDTLFAYSWLISALLGNANIVRLSTDAHGDTPIVLAAIGAVLKEHPEVAKTISFVRYGHEAAITEALSTSDMRVIWGGDRTVLAIRAIPMNPLGSELTFADRRSIAAFDASSVCELDDTGLSALAKQFYNDSYWFDQLGCSSPQTVFWRGEPRLCERAESAFLAALIDRVQQERYESPTAAILNKLLHSSVSSSDGIATSVSWRNPNLTIIRQPNDVEMAGEHPGSGLFSFRRIGSLAEVAPHIDPRIQTLSVFGFDPAELESFVVGLNGAGVDRVVPVGSALQFDRYWDGCDLLHAFSRKTHIHPGLAQTSMAQ